MSNVNNYFEQPGAGGDNKLVLGGSVETSGGTDIKEVTVQAEIDDISGANTGYILAPFAGTVSTVYTVVDQTIDATTVLTPSINGTPITGGAVSIAGSGSAGDVDSSTPTAANTVAAGDTISIVSDGATTTAASVKIVFVIAKS